MKFRFSPSQDKGYSVERLAAEHLKNNGLKIKSTNFTCKLGEIDIIAIDKGTLVFAEVRHRKSSRYGTPAETVTYSKQKKLIKASQVYIQLNKIDMPCRFDVIESMQEAEICRFNWIKNAFDGH